MRMFKDWFKRDRANRRSSDTAASIITSLDTEDTSLQDFSPRIPDDPIRTEEYKKALAEFFARRSIGPKTSLGAEKSKNPKVQLTPEPNKKASKLNDERRTKSEQKPKRRSLPEMGHRYTHTEFTSNQSPQIQFMFSNQVFLPGSGIQVKRGKPKRFREKKPKELNSPPDLLPNSEIAFEFTEDDDSPSSPPPDFFRDSSLPYIDKEISAKFDKDITSHFDTTLQSGHSKRRRHSRTRKERETAILDSSSTGDGDGDFKSAINDFADFEDWANAEFNRPTEASFESVARKLEEACRGPGESPARLFRGVVLARGVPGRTPALDPGTSPAPLAPGAWRRTRWAGAGVSLRGSPAASRDLHILTTIRHPNILLLMGLCYDLDHKIQCIFEECSTSLHDCIHKQGPIMSYQTSVRYLNDIASATSYLNANKYVHTAISSHSIMITSRDVAKLCGFELCSQTMKNDTTETKNKPTCDPYKIMYSSPEPEYVNIQVRKPEEVLSEEDPLLSSRSRRHLKPECVPQEAATREAYPYYRWQAPELFDNFGDLVYPNKKTDVYSLCLVLWECCNGAIPWKTLSYRQLSDLYLLWQTGIRLPQDGTYPQSLYDIMFGGLHINVDDRSSVEVLCKQFQSALKNLDLIENLNISNATQATNQEQVTDLDKLASKLDDTVELRSHNTNKDESSVECASVILKDIKKYEVTNIDQEDQSNEKREFILYDESHTQFYPGYHASDTKSINIESSLTSLSKENLLDSDYEIDMTNNTMHKTDSTEYCSLMTPDIRRFSSRVNGYGSASRPTKLQFLDESVENISNTKLPDKVLRLNTSFTPKSYKSLQISTPPADKVEAIRSLTNSVGRKVRRASKSKYTFEIKNTSLPSTPIARSTKIRKNAWLSGEEDDDLGYNETDLFIEESFKSQNGSLSVASPMQSDALKTDIEPKRLFATKTTNTLSRLKETPPKKRSPKRNTVSVGSSPMSPFAIKDAIPVLRRISMPVQSSAKDESATNLNKFRSRSQSWSTKSKGDANNPEAPVTGVDIKPLVAIHEKWILESKAKQTRSLSLPDNYRGSPTAIKPASHRLDPLCPRTASNHQNFLPENKRYHSLPASRTRTPRNNSTNYSDIPESVRIAITRRRIMNSKPDDFFEKSLWNKEKEKCTISKENKDDPQGSSTPYKPVSGNQSEVLPLDTVDNSTNTETFEELCKKIIKQNILRAKKISNNMIAPTKPPASRNNITEEKEEKIETSISSARSCIMNELTEIFNRITKTNETSKTQELETKTGLDNILADSASGDVTFNCDEILSSSEVMDSIFNTTFNIEEDDFLDEACKITDADEECSSLPDDPQPDESIHKALRRWQASTTLQNARSTEDMYIDDELSAHTDINCLSDNMQLIPLHGSIHEALCDKHEDCCLIKIQEESHCDRVFIVCDSVYKQKDKRYRKDSSSSYQSDEDIQEIIKVNSRTYIPNLHVENLPSMDLLIDLTPPKGLPVIEERSSEDEEASEKNDSYKNEEILNRRHSIKELILMYDKVDDKKDSNESFDKLKKSDSPCNEISFFIMDDGDGDREEIEKKYNLSQCPLDLSGSLIADVINV